MATQLNFTLLLTVGMHGSAQAADQCQQLFALKSRESKILEQNRLVSLLPDTSIFDSRLYAFHLTDVAPKDGVLRVGHDRGHFRPTVHFALGEPVVDHRFGNWSARAFGIITPFRSIRNQVVGFFPQDTFTLGSVRLGPDSVLIVPAGQGQNFPEFKGRIVEYHSGQKIKDVMLTEHEKLKGLRLNATRDNEVIALKVGSEVVNIESALLRDRFAERVLGDAYSHVFRGHHADSPFGMLDLVLLDYLSSWFKSGLVQNMYRQDIFPDFVSTLIQFDEALAAVKRQVRKMKLSAESQADFQMAMKEADSQRRLLVAEIELQRRTGKSFFHSGPQVHAQIYALRFIPEDLNRKIAELTPSLVRAPAPRGLALDPQRIFNYMPFSNLTTVERIMDLYFPGPNPKKAEWMGQALISRLLTNQISIEEALASFEKWWPETNDFYRYQSFLAKVRDAEKIGHEIVYPQVVYDFVDHPRVRNRLIAAGLKP